MIHDPIDPRARYHRLGCACHGCAPPGPADRPTRADRLARASALMLVGIGFVLTIDLLAGARALRALLGF